MPDPGISQLPDWLSLRSRTHADKLAIRDKDESITYSELNHRVRFAESQLTELGFADGQILCVLAENSIEFAVLFHTAIRMKAPFVPLNSRLTVHELAWETEHCGAEFLVTDDSNQALGTNIAEITEIAIVDLGTLTSGSTVNDQEEQNFLEADNPLALIYTSGTTGLPKLASLSHLNFYWSAIASAANIGVEERDSWLVCMPLFHVGGLSILMRAAIYGISAVIHTKFDVESVNTELDSGAVSLVSLVPTMLDRLLNVVDSPARYSDSLRAVLLGGGPATVDLIRQGLDRGIPILQTYGLTEATSQVATVSQQHAVSHAGSAGRPLLASTVKLRGSIDLPMTEVTSGEILVRGRTISTGYYEKSVISDGGKFDDGWLCTSDLATRDEKGFLTVVGRADDVILSGGENVHPEEIESVINSQDGVVESAVFGVPDKVWGQKVVAVLRVETSETFDLEAIEGILRLNLAGYKVPKKWEVVESALPRTASGKLKRFQVAEEFTQQ